MMITVSQSDDSIREIKSNGITELFKYGQMMIPFSIIYCSNADNETGSVNNCALFKQGWWQNY